MSARKWVAVGSWIGAVLGGCTCSPYGSSHERSCGEEPLCDIGDPQTAAMLVAEHNEAVAELRSLTETVATALAVFDAVVSA